MKHLKKTVLFLFVIAFGTYAQTLTVKGNVSSPDGAIRNASITFINSSDTTMKFTAFTDTAGNYSIDVVTSVNNVKSNVPTDFKLGQNYPNPFATSTDIPYELKKPSDVKVTVYDILGRVVKHFTVGLQSSGVHSVIWDGKNNAGAKIAAGVYFYRLQANGQSLVKKMVFNSGSGNITLPAVNNFSFRTAQTPSSSIAKVQGINYTVMVDNAPNILPAIIPQQFTGVIVLNNDTTINFSVKSQNKAMVYLDSTQQIIRGFGAANIVGWRPDMTSSEINTAFGTGQWQLGFTILRLRIQPDSNQWSSNVATAKKAYDMGATIIASPWNPPSNMAETINGQKSVNPNMYAAYAKYLNDFYNYMKRNGVPVYAISVQNEPDYANSWTGWTPDQMLNFMKNNASVIETKVMAPESFQFRHSYSDPILNDSVACSNLDIVAGHIYGAGLGPYPLAEKKGKEIWMTEHYTDSQHSGDDWPLALQVGTEINNCMNAGMSAYVWWYIVRFYGPIGDGTNGTMNGIVTKRGYVMSQFSRFIRPGYYKIENNTMPQGNVFQSAFRDSSSSKVVIVAINNSAAPIYQTFTVENGVMSSFTPYTTSQSMDCDKGNDIKAINGSFTAVLEPTSITTFVSNK